MSHFSRRWAYVSHENEQFLKIEDFILLAVSCLSPVEKAAVLPTQTDTVAVVSAGQGSVSKLAN